MHVYSLIPVVFLKIQNVIKNKKNYLLFLFLISIIPAFYNSNVTLDIGLTDAYVYQTKYLNLLEGGLVGGGELGFEYFSLLLAKIRVPIFFYFFTIHFFQTSVVYKFIKKYSIKPVFSMMIYSLTFYGQHNFNIIRQGIAVTFTLIAMDLLINKKIFRSVLIAVVAVTFHESAIIFLITYLIPRSINLKRVHYVFGLVLTFFISMGFGKYFNRLILNLLNLFRLNYTYSSTSFFIEYRMTYQYLLYLLFLFIITLFIINSLETLKSHQQFIFKLFYIGVIYTMLFSTSVIFRRFGNYFLIYQCVLLPNILLVFKEKKIVEYGLLILFILLVII